MEEDAQVSVEPLDAADYDLAADWLSRPQINRWLAAEWRGRQVDARVLAVVCMNPRNRLLLIRHGGQACGLVGMGCINRVDRTAMMWYLLGDPDQGGRGIMTRAAGSAVRWAFRELGLQSITASLMAPNEASRRVLEKNGFREAGTLREGFVFEGGPVDRILFDLLPEDLGLPAPSR